MSELKIKNNNNKKKTKKKKKNKKKKKQTNKKTKTKNNITKIEKDKPYRKQCSSQPVQQRTVL